jgi:hypothetical protein
VVLIDAGVQGLRAIHLKAVVLGSASVDAVRYTSGHPDAGFILLGLIADAGRQGDELREVPPVQLNGCDFLASDGAAYLGAFQMQFRQFALTVVVSASEEAAR